MQKSTVAVAVLVVASLAVAGWFVADAYFLPEESRRVDQPLPSMDTAGTDTMEDGMEDGAMEENASMSPGLRALARGVFRDGDSLHHVGGTVTLYEMDGAPFLRFEDYEATDGPDVYIYLVRGATDTVDADDVKVLVPEGKDGHATLRGNFNVPLPAGMDWTSYDGIVVWCDRFDVEFGSAALSAA